MLKSLLVLPIVLSTACFGMYDKLSVNPSDFSVFDGKVKHHVNPYDVDKSLRSMNRLQLQSFLAQGGKIRASKLDNGEYVVRAHVPGLGGGPILGAITCIVGMTVTGVGAIGTGVAVFATTGDPFAAGGSAWGVATAGTAATAYATAAATASPTP